MELLLILLPLALIGALSVLCAGRATTAPEPAPAPQPVALDDDDDVYLGPMPHSLRRHHAEYWERVGEHL